MTAMSFCFLKNPRHKPLAVGPPGPHGCGRGRGGASLYVTTTTTILRPLPHSRLYGVRTARGLCVGFFLLLAT